MGSPNKRDPKSPLKQWVLHQGGGCMHGNCCKQKIENNKKIKLLVHTHVEGPTNCNAATSTPRLCRKLVVKVKVKVFTNVEGPTNCNAATSTTR